MLEWREQGCAWCPERCADALVAHHLDPSTKLFSVSDGVKRGCSARRMLAELAKCICLCCNCHAKHHAEERRAKAAQSAPGP